jgi:hypothetical protein
MRLTNTRGVTLIKEELLIVCYERPVLVAFLEKNVSTYPFWLQKL